MRAVDLGRRAYAEVLDLQRRLARGRRGAAPDHDLLLLVEHDPVITIGRGGDPKHVVAPAGWLSERGIDVIEIERGGDVTYHGPGQLVGYPIMDLHAYRLDLHWFLRRLEEVLLRVLGESDLPGYRVEGYTGAWTGEVPPQTARIPGSDGFDQIGEAAAEPLIKAGSLRKIASIGIHASRWITWHGFALNVGEAPLVQFPGIVPCGIENVRMTSLAREGRRVTLAEAREQVLRGFNAAFPFSSTRWMPETVLDQ